MFALNVSEDGRILSATLAEFAAPDMPLVETLPEGDIGDWRYLNGAYVSAPVEHPAIEQPADDVAALRQQVAQMQAVLDALLGEGTT